MYLKLGPVRTTCQKRIFGLNVIIRVSVKGKSVVAISLLCFKVAEPQPSMASSPVEPALPSFQIGICSDGHLVDRPCCWGPVWARHPRGSEIVH